MSVELIAENELREALLPQRVDPRDFEAAVRERIRELETETASDPLVRLSPLARAAAAFLPLEVLAGCAVPTSTSKAAPAGGLYKLLSYVTLPAISLFVLLGASIFTFFKIRGIQGKNTGGLTEAEAIQESLRAWRRRHLVGSLGVLAVSVVLAAMGASSLLFLFFLVSLGVLVYVLSSLAKAGIGNRDVVGRACGMGLSFLGLATAGVPTGSQEMHFLDQRLLTVVLYAGVLLLLPYIFSGMGTWMGAGATNKPQPVPRSWWITLAVLVAFQLGMIGLSMLDWTTPGWIRLFVSVSPTRRLRTAAIFLAAVLVILLLRSGVLKPRQLTAVRWSLAALMIVLIVPVMAFSARSVLWPATPERIKHYVESFDTARFSSASWANWEIAARWTLDAHLQPDLTKPRRLLAAELAGEQNPHVLSSAMRVGLMTPEQVKQLSSYEQQRRLLFLNRPGGKQPDIRLGQYDWVIRAAVLKNDLAPAERDQLEQRLVASFEGLFDDKYVTLESVHHMTQLLAAIGRTINREHYREQVHDLLRKFHSKNGGWGRINGGFRTYRSINAGNGKATAHAVELMEIFGVPDDLDILWVRSFLRPGKFSDEQWIAAATLNRLDEIPDVRRPSVLDYLYYERTLLAAIALVGLCLYATFTSPRRSVSLPANQPCPA